MSYTGGAGGPAPSAVEAVARSVMLGAMVRVLQLVGIPLGLMVIGWMASSLLALQQEATRVSERAESARTQILVVQTAVDKINDLIIARAATRYTREDAIHDLGIIERRMEDHERRLESIERDHGKLMPHAP